MAYDPRVHHRRSIRLPGYDYTRPGPYFVTIVTKNRASIFGEIVTGEMRLNQCGKIAHAEWMKTADIRRAPERNHGSGSEPEPFARGQEIELDEFVIMPNHIHAIIAIVESENGSIKEDGLEKLVGSSEMDVGARRRRAPTTIEQFAKPISGSIPTIIRAYKSAVTKRINQSRGTPGAPVWQRNYWEHIIRNADELSRIREYIRYNPVVWETDDENTDRRRSR